jgi:23S rRNA pseudouridine2605 synthase
VIRAAVGVRLQRVLAAAGVSSRRAAEQMIGEGRVSVNGEVVRQLPVFVKPGEDRIEVDGRPLAREAVRTEPRGGRVAAHRSLYMMLYKPERVMSTTNDDGGRTTVMDLVDHPAIRGDVPVGLGGQTGRVYPVGRLDFHTSGLVLLTNDGELTHRLTHASYGVSKTYEVMVRGSIPEGELRRIEEILNKGHRKAARRSGRASKAERPLELRVLDRRDGKSRLEIELWETGERSLGELLMEADLKVVKVTRTKLGPLALTHLPVGGWRELERDELWALREATGLLKPRGGSKGSGGGRAKAGRAEGQQADGPGEPMAPAPVPAVERRPVPARRPRPARPEGPARGPRPARPTGGDGPRGGRGRTGGGGRSGGGQRRGRA